MGDLPRLVCISGPDGVGKTAQSKLLIDTLISDGIRAKYAWLRFNHFISLPLLAYMRVAGLSRTITLPDGNRIGIHDLSEKSFFKGIYELSILVDLFIASIFKVYLPIAGKKTVICDRYIIDTLVDIMINTKEMEFHKSTIGRMFLRIAPRGARYIILLMSSDTLRTRRYDIEFDTFLQERIRLYNIVSSDLKEIDIHTLDVEGLPIESVQALIRNIIGI